MPGAVCFRELFVSLVKRKGNPVLGCAYFVALVGCEVTGVSL